MNQSINPSTKRGQERRKRLRKLGLTVVQVEASFTEKELIKRTANAMGYKNVSEMILLETIKNAANFGITAEKIHLESQGKLSSV